ncbi:PilN domain-containing protein [sulfur-oxidizing endosymbiont of Gigantopelta aegis]|uniref:PilN domain-containing protein n=1 Tax=sulfur-oxidizing endosymbiont of Gigantopelta aegis TaxID=2794934 RepID=UPI0018DE610D|nr:PilN domain-containing protein [sulfur-oxidizing endosymbiont of Gigantopelta aegis]
MARINLLNWREERRKQIEQQFYGMLAAAGIAGVAVVFAVQMQLGAMIDYQSARNGYLKSEIKKVEKAIAEIKALEKKKSDLLSRMNVIQELQGNRSDSVHMLDEMVKVLPEGVHLNKFNQKKKQLTFDGVAQSNARVSAYMRNIERAEWLKNPKLKVIQSKKKGKNAEGYSQFTLTSQQANPEKKKANKAKKAKG